MNAERRLQDRKYTFCSFGCLGVYIVIARRFGGFKRGLELQKGGQLCDGLTLKRIQLQAFFSLLVVNLHQLFLEISFDNRFV